MIYTVTFNPALDYVIRLDKLVPGTINRLTHENVMPGGKGINVSIVLKNLDHDSCALGFIANFTGDALASLVSAHGCKTDFIRSQQGMTRINVKLKAEEETELNGIGPQISPDEIEQLFAKLDRLVADDMLVISGSVPKTLPSDMYEQIMSRLAGRGIRIVVDAELDLLLNVLQYHPFLIKPNNHELGAIFDVELKTREEVIPYAKKLQARGARNILVSVAGEGAVFVSENGEVYTSVAPKGTVVNSVGAGDSMVAGFIAGWIESGRDMQHAFKVGICTGSASAFSADFATRDEVQALLASLAE